MIPHVVEAKYFGGHRVWLRFDDGSCGEVDLADELDGPVFEPLKNVECFRQFLVRYNTLSWQNGADFAPEFLREILAQHELCLPGQRPRIGVDRHKRRRPLASIVGQDFPVITTTSEREPHGL